MGCESVRDRIRTESRIPVLFAMRKHVTVTPPLWAAFRSPRSNSPRRPLTPRFARPLPARAGARGEVKEIPFSRRVFTPELCPRPSKQTTAERDLRQTAPMVGPAAITIMHG